MLLTIRTTHRPATDLGFLLHKHPDHVHTREFPFGNATVFYPEAGEESCTAAIVLDVDPIGMVRGRGGKGGRVKSRKQAIAIGLSEARKAGAKVPKKAVKKAKRKTAKRKSKKR